MKKSPKVILIITIVSVVILATSYLYSISYHRADEISKEIFTSGSVTIEQENSVYIIFPPNQADINKGLIFYPGYKVEAIGYLPLLQQIAKKGITCVLVDMPLQMPMLGINAADEVYSLVPAIDQWYICGHSNGGDKAIKYLENNSDNLEGLILLGADSKKNCDIPTLIIYGTWDTTIDKSDLSGCENVVEIVDGNHAYFGNYGEAFFDGEAKISREEQQRQAVNAIYKFIIQE